MDDAAKQPGGVDGREFASPEAVSGLDVDEVIEEAVLLFRFISEELERCQGTLSRSRVVDISASFGDAQCAEGEAGGGRAADATIVIPICFGAVFGDASPRRRLLVEVSADPP